MSRITPEAETPKPQQPTETAREKYQRQEAEARSRGYITDQMLSAGGLFGAPRRKKRWSAGLKSLLLLVALTGAVVVRAGPDAGQPEPTEGARCQMEWTVWPDGKPVTGRWIRAHEETGGTDGERHVLPQWHWKCGTPATCEGGTILCEGHSPGAQPKPCVLTCKKGGR